MLVTIIHARNNIVSSSTSLLSQLSILNALTLEQSHVDIYLVRPNKLNSKVHNFFKEIISSSEQEKIEQKRTNNDKQDALITRGLIRCVLSRYKPLTPNQWQFKKGWNGKPSVSSTCLSTENDIEFNLSHANGLIACAITKSSPLGIDVEYTKRKSNTYKLASRYFSESENADLNAQPYDQQPIEFYNYWTLKESYIKACGDGLSIPLKHFSFDITVPQNIKLNFDAARDDNPVHWTSLLFNVSDDHTMALTVKKAPTNIQQQEISTTIYEMNEHGEFEITSLPLS